MFISKVSLKIYFSEDKIIRVSVLEDEKLQNIITKYIKSSNRLTYLDDENEWVSLINEEDWKTAINIYKNELNSKTLKIKGKSKM